MPSNRSVPVSGIEMLNCKLMLTSNSFSKSRISIQECFSHQLSYSHVFTLNIFTENSTTRVPIYVFTYFFIKVLCMHQFNKFITIFCRKCSSLQHTAEC